MVVKFFERRVAAKAVAREFRWRAGLKGEIMAYRLEQGFYLVRFSEPGEKEKVLNRSWVVNGQVVAMEPWQPGFLLVEGAISSALVWILLSRLPMEYWGEAALQRLLGAAGDFVSVDECTAARRRVGFARACAKVDFRQPLRLGVLIMGPEGPFWQRFVYENLDGLCFGCGRMHSTDVSCPFSKGAGEVDSTRKEAPEDGSCGPRLGPWLLAVRRRQSGRNGVVELGKKTTIERRPPGSSSQPIPGGDGWLKAHKVARRWSPARPASGATGGELSSGQKEGEGRSANPFFVLGRGPMVEENLGGPTANAQPKRARQSEPEVGWAMVKLFDKAKGLGRPKKGQPTSSRDKGKLIV